MGWGPPDCISHVIRDGLVLEVTCRCGHVARPDLIPLRQALWRTCGGERLDYVRSALVCSECGADRPSYRLLPPAK